VRPPTFFLLLRGCAFSQLLIHNFWLYLIDDSIKLLEKAFERIPLDKGLSSLYQYCAELMTSSNRIDDSIKLLEKAIERIPPDEGLSSLFHYCAELMTSSNRIDDAIKLLEKAVEEMPPDKGLSPLYQYCAELMAAQIASTTQSSCWRRVSRRSRRT